MPDDPRQELVLLVNRLGTVPRAGQPPIVLQILPRLGDAQLPVPFRVAAAARVLRLIPDRERPVRRVARALTRGLSPSRRLERLRHLQHHVDACQSLDAYIDDREKRVKLACPRCRVRLPRIEMIKHLWHEHGLNLDRGKTRTVERLAVEFHERYRASGDPDPLDRAVELAGIAGLRKWLATQDPPAEETAPLVHAARSRAAGLCPGCYAELPAAVSPLPEPLALANGRLSGDGYAVAIGGNAWFHTTRVATPDRPTSVGARSLAPRAAATLAAAGILLITLLFARTFNTIAVGFGFSVIAYLVVRFLRSDGESHNDRAVNAAWSQFASRVVERPDSVRFLTRLCRASLGRGEPEARALMLNAIAAHAAGRANDSDADLQLLSAASVLQVEDLAAYGRDVVAGIAALAAEGFAGQKPADSAEFVVGSYFTRDRDPGDAARLRILLIRAAFEAGLVPRDLLDIWAGAPNLRRAMAVEPTHRLGLLLGLWRTRNEKAWQAIGAAETVFDLARTSPPTAARVLARFPDLLLYHRLEPKLDDLIGPILICSRGVAVAGVLSADPDADVRLAANGRDLIFGRHRIELSQPLPDDFPELIKKWLRFRADVLLPFIDGYLARGTAEVSRRVLGPFCRRCLACGTVSAVARGEIGRVVTGL